MKSTLLIASFITALTASFAAVAADAPAAPAADTAAAPAEKAPAAKKKAKRHSHAEANKQGVAMPEPTASEGEAKKPLHEHQKVHK